MLCWLVAVALTTCVFANEDLLKPIVLPVNTTRTDNVNPKNGGTKIYQLHVGNAEAFVFWAKGIVENDGYMIISADSDLGALQPGNRIGWAQAGGQSEGQLYSLTLGVSFPVANMTWYASVYAPSQNGDFMLGYDVGWCTIDSDFNNNDSPCSELM